MKELAEKIQKNGGFKEPVNKVSDDLKKPICGSLKERVKDNTVSKKYNY